MMMLTSFFYMGGYAMYVWPAYGITFLILLFNFIFAYRKGCPLTKETHASNS